MKVVVNLDLEQDKWVDSRKRELGLKRREYVLRNLVREAMILQDQANELAFEQSRDSKEVEA
jgi:hypothetical protein